MKNKQNTQEKRDVPLFLKRPKFTQRCSFGVVFCFGIEFFGTIFIRSARLLVHLFFTIFGLYIKIWKNMVKISCDFFARAIYALFFKKMNMNVVKNANGQKTNERKCKYVQKNNCFSLDF